MADAVAIPAAIPVSGSNSGSDDGNIVHTFLNPFMKQFDCLSQTVFGVTIHRVIEVAAIIGTLVGAGFCIYYGVEEPGETAKIIFSGTVTVLSALLAYVEHKHANIANLRHQVKRIEGAVATLKEQNDRLEDIEREYASERERFAEENLKLESIRANFKEIIGRFSETVDVQAAITKLEGELSVQRTASQQELKQIAKDQKRLHEERKRLLELLRVQTDRQEEITKKMAFLFLRESVRRYGKIGFARIVSQVMDKQKAARMHEPTTVAARSAASSSSASAASTGH